MSNIAKNRVQSTWTPLGNEEFNQKSLGNDISKSTSKGPDPLRGIFEERRALVGKWFDKWTDGQRKQVLEELIGKCKAKQLQFTSEIVSKKKPTYHEDFTRSLPRVLSLYVFSFLDPRSLCRCAQVCWHWKYLTEVDQIWLPKCCRLGWVLTFSPSPYEAGVWKRLYIENILALKCLTPKIPKDIALSDVQKSTSKMSLLATIDSKNLYGTPRNPKDSRPPWRGSDPAPKDTWRNNYLANDDEIEKVNKLRKRGVHGSEASEMTQRVTNKINSGLQVTKKPSAVTRSKSATNLRSSNNDRPDWARPVEGDPGYSSAFVNQSMAGDIDPRTAAPAVVKSPNKKLSTQRSARDPPSSDLFPAQPWKVPHEEEYDSEVY